jgi:RNA polymerase sigma-70 factor (ECF subfamily)
VIAILPGKGNFHPSLLAGHIPVRGNGKWNFFGKQVSNMTENGGKSDIELIERFKNGDESAFELLVGAHAAKAYQIAFGLLGNSLDAEEVVQDAFLKVHAKLRDFRGDSSFGTWFHRIVTNLSRNKYHWNRRRGAQVNVSMSGNQSRDDSRISDMEISDSNLSPDVLIGRMETAKTLMEAIGKLPENLREALVLRHVDEASYAEMADILGVELGTVKSRLARAREALRMKFAEVE